MTLWDITFAKWLFLLECSFSNTSSSVHSWLYDLGHQESVYHLFKFTESSSLSWSRHWCPYDFPIVISCRSEVINFCICTSSNHILFLRWVWEHGTVNWKQYWKWVWFHQVCSPNSQLSILLLLWSLAHQSTKYESQCGQLWQLWLEAKLWSRGLPTVL